jgi:hypothetical protein
MKEYTLDLKFKILFYIGIVLLFISMFLPWYWIEMTNSDGKTIALWYYNPFTEWTTHLSKKSDVNNAFRPEDLNMPITLNVLYVALMFVSLYSVIFKDITKEDENLQKLKPYSNSNIFLVLISFYYIVIFPAYYITMADLYFPFIVFEDDKFETNIMYMIGPGYYCQIIGVICIFPYLHHYHMNINKFVIDSQAKEYKNEEPIDLDLSIKREMDKRKGILYDGQDIQSEIRKIKERVRYAGIQ